MRTAKPCGPDTRGWCQLPVATSIQPDRPAIKPAATEARGIRLRGARHKPSNHCAGNAGLLRLYLYARVHFLRTHSHTRPRVQQAPGIPCTLCFEGRDKVHANLGRRASRERVAVFSWSHVIASEAKQSIVTERAERWIGFAPLAMTTLRRQRTRSPTSAAYADPLARRKVARTVSAIEVSPMPVTPM
jgi:hypothetical protein